MKRILLGLMVMFASLTVAQTKLTGTVIDGEYNEPLLGASVFVKGTSTGSTTDFDGKFELSTSETSGQLVISYLGYLSKTISFNGSANLGNIVLSPDVNQMKDIVVVGKGVVDLADDRKTPIAVSTIKAVEIQAKAGNFDLPEVLKSTPSVQNIKGGGYGDGSMYLRGFDQTNTAFLLNGQPINGMEDGKMYWSNWSGVLDIANAVQVQRGLGSSKLAISSVGGTVNIVTKTVDTKEGGFVSSMVGNNNYIKTSAYYSTGLSDKGWAFSAMFGHWQGDGYVDNTEGQGQTYFISAGYKPNEKNIFNFLITGAPQWHAAAGSASLQDFLDNGIRYNNWNYDINGEKYPGGRNFYHKPIANLSWDWTINEKSSLSTVLYGSMGRGGFASVLTSSGTPTYARGSYNNHNWYGLVSNYNRELTENLNLNFGADVRLYNGIHFRGVTDFFSVDSVNQTNNNIGSFTVTDTFGGYNPWNAIFNPNNAHDQRIAYDYEENINYYGAFGQLEYSKNNFSAFFQGAVSNQSHQKTDYWNYTTDEKSKKVENLGYNLKAGLAYRINDTHKVFANGGYYSRQPFHDDLFRVIRYSNDLIDPQVDNQDILGLEAGYQLNMGNFSANVNLYNTTWDNRTLLGDNGQTNDPSTAVYYQTQGVKQVHSGIELDASYRVIDNLIVNGFLSLGNWEYKGNARVRAYNDAGEDITSTLDSNTLNLDGVKVGGAAQSTAGLGAVYTAFKNFNIDGNFNWYNSLYSDVGATENTIALPQYETVDLGLSYKLFVGKMQKNNLQFRFNMNNVFDERYIEKSTTSTPVTSTSENVWKGVDTSNSVRFGYGRTWNFSVRFNF